MTATLADRQSAPPAVQSRRRLTLVPAGPRVEVFVRGGIPGVLYAAAAPRAALGGDAGREARLRALVEAARRGDLGAFEELYELTRADAARTLFHLVGRRAEIEDLLQEVYLQLLKAVKGYRGEAAFRTFLYRLCANVALMHLRWRRRRPEDVMAEPPERAAEGADPEREAARREASRLVQAALEALSAKKRIVFVYHELCEMGPEEIAAAVGTSANTVRSRLHHARLEFNEAMQRLLTSGGGGRHGVR